MNNPASDTDIKDEPLFFVLCLGALACVAELEVCLALMSPPDFLAAFMIHAATLCYLGMAVLYLRTGGKNFRFSFLLFLACGFLGPYGALLGFLAPAVFVLCPKSKSDPLAWMEAFFQPPHMSDDEKIQEQLVLGVEKPLRKYAVEPFQDVLAFGSILQKQMAIAQMTRYFCPAFAPLLLQAARNPEPAVRVQAATALAHIERDFMAKRMRLENDIRRFPLPDRQLALARLYDTYAFTGLVDADTRQLLRDNAIRIYERYLTGIKDLRTSVFLARLYVRRGLPEKAVETLKAFALAGQLSPDEESWYMEALFRQRRLKELREYVYITGKRGPYHFRPFHKLGDIFPAWKENIDVA